MAETAQAAKSETNASCLHAWISGAVSGCLAGLVGGMVWGIVQEKKFIFRNMHKEYHLREDPIVLFSIMMRGTKTMVIMGAFVGVLSGLRCSLGDRFVSRSNFLLPGAAGTAAGLVRTLVAQVPLPPAVHAQKAMGSGLLAAGAFAAAELLDPKDVESALDAAADKQH